METTYKQINNLFKFHCLTVLDSMGNTNMFKCDNYTKITLTMEGDTSTSHSSSRKSSYDAADLQDDFLSFISFFFNC